MKFKWLFSVQPKAVRFHRALLNARAPTLKSRVFRACACMKDVLETTTGNEHRVQLKSIWIEVMNLISVFGAYFECSFSLYYFPAEWLSALKSIAFHFAWLVKLKTKLVYGAGSNYAPKPRQKIEFLLVWTLQAGGYFLPCLHQSPVSVKVTFVSSASRLHRSRIKFVKWRLNMHWGFRNPKLKLIHMCIF